MKTLYQEIRDKLESEISGVHVRLWNNQVEFSEEGQQIPFPFPAVFIDFPQIDWIQRGKGTQTVDTLTVRAYICFESYNTAENEEDLAVFDLREEVYLALQDFKPTNAAKLERRTEQTDPRHTNIYVWIIDFVTNYQDTTAQFPRNSQNATISTLNITKDLEIDPNTVDGIRTASEFEE